MTPASKITEDAYEPALMEFVAAGGNLVAVEGGDGSPFGVSSFKEAYPERVFNLGSAEQDMILAAAGLALGGKNVCVSS
ncbi:MAG: hypothetical protein GX843_07600, partial [Synergistaceae bacterium]|nr:hypothetical protein [Synergistaceae bacterium]